MYGRAVTTKHKLQSHSPPPSVSFPALFPTSCLCLSLVLFASCPLPFCFHSDYLPISFVLPLLCLSPPSLLHLPCRCCSSRLTLHPSLPTNAPALLLLLGIFKAAEHTLAHSITHSSPAWEKHVSYSGPGPDCMLWEWSGE